MSSLKCERCGSESFTRISDDYVCSMCGERYSLDKVRIILSQGDRAFQNDRYTIQSPPYQQQSNFPPQPYQQMNYPGAAVQTIPQKKKKKTGVLIISGVVLLLIVGAILFYFFYYLSPKNQIIGTWISDETHQSVTFNRDGTCISNGMTLNYSVESNNDLILTSFGYSVTLKYSSDAKTSKNSLYWYIEGDKLYFTGTTATRAGSSGQTGASSTAPELTHSQKADAATLSHACKELYAGVKSGTINNSTKGFISKELPVRNASASERASAAEQLTVGDAAEYNNLTVDIYEMVYVTRSFKGHTKGTILYKSDAEISGNESCVGQLSNQTMLGALYS